MVASSPVERASNLVVSTLATPAQNLRGATGRSMNQDTPTPPAPPHVPVLIREAIQWLAPEPGARLVDGTLGAGGHAESMLEAVGEAGRVYGIDRDPEAHRLAAARLERFGDRFVPLRGRHEDLIRLLDEAGVRRVDGLLLDLGLSSMQLSDPGRGFSFRHDGPLDMRMDPERGRPASDIVATASEDELRRILRTWGEERRASAIAGEIVRVRDASPITRTTQLATLVERVLGPSARQYRIHPATRTFQALRIVANGEVEGLRRLVEDATGRLRPGGRIVVISYHSLEDRAIKQSFRALAHRCTCPPRLPVCACGRRDLLRVLTSRPVRPSGAEVASNPRARSARLRAAEVLA
jgi:16S rRNA (cytosine1402-N4)-methyltransferase